MLRLRGRAVKRRASSEAAPSPFPWRGTQTEPEQTWCSGSPVEQGAAPAASRALMLFVLVSCALLQDRLLRSCRATGPQS